MSLPKGAVSAYHKLAGVAASQRVAGPFSTEAQLKALTPGERVDRMTAAVVETSGSRKDWSYVASSTASASARVLVPTDAPPTGRWHLNDTPVAEISLANGKVLIGDASGLATEQTVSGDATLSAAGALTIAANAVETTMLNFTLAAETGSAAVVLDHADSSPKELLAANANVDRLVRVKGVATQAAAGEPDIDVGSATTDTNGVVDDVGAGAWKVGDEFEGVILLPAGEALVATIAAAGTAGAFNVFIDAIVIPKPVVEAVAGQDETGDTTIPVTGIAAGDELVAVTVFASGVPTTRALTDFTVGAGEITVGANAANNAANKYLIHWLDKT